MAIGRITPDLLMELNGLMREQLDCIKTKDVKRQEKLDDAFHRTLYEAVENATLIELIFSNWERIKQARCSSTVLPEHGQRWITESIKRHKKVLEALRKKDELLAYQVIVDNIESSQEEITSCLEKMEWIEPEKDASSNPK